MTLADASHTSPSAIRYRQLGIGGRAEVAGPWRARGWQFSLSHRDGVAICAVAKGPVGANIGDVAGMADQRELADQICTAGERAQLAGLPPAARQQQLLRLWTCKEAIAKADGRGTGLRFTDISTDGAVGAIHGNDREWFIASTWVTPHHLATVAVGAHAAHNAQMSFTELM
jgi:phosphopantetheinyl transferase